MKNKRWSAKENQLLIKTIQKNPSNLNKCFVAVGKKLNKNPAAVSMHYYSQIRNKVDVFSVNTPTNKIVNTKNKFTKKSDVTTITIPTKLVEKLNKIIEIILN